MLKQTNKKKEVKIKGWNEKDKRRKIENKIQIFLSLSIQLL